MILISRTIFFLLLLCPSVLAEQVALMPLPASVPAEPSWTFVCEFGGYDSGGTTYTAGGSDSGFSSGTLSTANMVDEDNDFMLIDASGEHMDITRTNDTFQSDEGLMEVRFKWTDTNAGDTDIVSFGTSTQNFIEIEIGDNGSGRFRHRGDGSMCDVSMPTSTFTSGDIARIRVRWLATGNNTTDVLSYQLDLDDDGTYDSWVDNTDDDAVTTWTSEPTDNSIGNGETIYDGDCGNAVEIYWEKYIHDHDAI